MRFIRASYLSAITYYALHTSVISVSYPLIMRFIRASYLLAIHLLCASYERHICQLSTYYTLHTSVISVSYPLIMRFIRASYLPAIHLLCASYERHIYHLSETQQSNRISEPLNLRGTPNNNKCSVDCDLFILPEVLTKD